MNKMVRNNVDLIFVSSSLLVKVAKTVTANSKTPVVVAPVSSAITAGIARSSRYPGQNITGVQMGGTMAKALQWHTRVLPAVKKILVPYNQSDLIATGSLEDLEKAAEELGITLVTRRVESPEELRAAFAQIPPGTGAIWLLPSNFLDSNHQLFMEASKTHKLPVSSSTAVFSGMNLFLSYGPDLEKMGKQASRLVGMVLNGKNPGDIPIEPAEFFLKINLRVAGELGIDVPEEILKQADEIIR
jgi:putative ABC transport system substrate-binding protein